MCTLGVVEPMYRDVYKEYTKRMYFDWVLSQICVQIPGTRMVGKTSWGWCRKGVVKYFALLNLGIFSTAETATFW